MLTGPICDTQFLIYTNGPSSCSPLIIPILFPVKFLANVEIYEQKCLKNVIFSCANIHTHR